MYLVAIVYYCVIYRIFGFIVKKRKEAYESASEAAGMALEYLSQVENEVEGEVHDLVSHNLLFY